MKRQEVLVQRYPCVLGDAAGSAVSGENLQTGFATSLMIWNLVLSLPVVTESSNAR